MEAQNSKSSLAARVQEIMPKWHGFPFMNLTWDLLISYKLNTSPPVWWAQKAWWSQSPESKIAYEVSLRQLELERFLWLINQGWKSPDIDPLVPCWPGTSLLGSLILENMGHLNWRSGLDFGTQGSLGCFSWWWTESKREFQPMMDADGSDLEIWEILVLLHWSQKWWKCINTENIWMSCHILHTSVTLKHLEFTAVYYQSRWESSTWSSPQGPITTDRSTISSSHKWQIHGILQGVFWPPVSASRS